MEINGNLNSISIEPCISVGRSSSGESANVAKKREKVEQTQEANKELNSNIGKKLSEEDIIGVIEKANKDFIVYDRKFEFSIHEKTKQIMIKVIDATNDEVIRELPPEKVLDMVAAMWEVAGIIVDRKI